MRLGAADPIYALIAYLTIGLQKGTIPDLLTQGYRSQMAFTHMGAYLGLGRTSNAPESYHGRKWGVSRYPANAVVVSLAGVDQAVLNRNAHLAEVSWGCVSSAWGSRKSSTCAMPCGSSTS